MIREGLFPTHAHKWSMILAKQGFGKQEYLKDFSLSTAEEEGWEKRDYFYPVHKNL